jgi:hypothetical protein
VDSVSAQDIQKANPLLTNLPENVREDMKRKFGDINNDADAAARASAVLIYIKSSLDADGKERSRDATGNGRIDGFDNQGLGAHGSEAGLLQDYFKSDAAALKTDHRLDSVNPQSQTDRRNEIIATIEDYKIDTGDEITSLDPETRLEDIYAESRQKLKDIHYDARFGQDKYGNNLPELPRRDDKRPEDDTRDAGAIINSDEGDGLDFIIKQKNQGDKTASNIYNGLQKQVGNFEKDPDAAWRAVKVIEYVKTVNKDGLAYSPGKLADNKGPTQNFNQSSNAGVHLGFYGYTVKDKQANTNTPAAGIQDFCKYGYTSLVAKEDEKPTPSAEDLTAEDIQEANPLLANLGNQKGPDVQLGLRDGLKAQVGDFDNDPDPVERKKAAARAVEVLDWIKGSTDKTGQERDPDLLDNGKIEGPTDDSDIRQGTEAALLQDFNKYGPAALKSDRALDETPDSHVFPDGTNKDNVQWASGEAAKYLMWIPALGPALEGLGNSKDANSALQAVGKALTEAGITALADLLVPGNGAIDVVLSVVAEVLKHTPNAPQLIKDLTASLQNGFGGVLENQNTQQGTQGKVHQQPMAQDKDGQLDDGAPEPQVVRAGKSKPKKPGNNRPGPYDTPKPKNEPGKGPVKKDPSKKRPDRPSDYYEKNSPPYSNLPSEEANKKLRSDLDTIPQDFFGVYPPAAGQDLAGKPRPRWSTGTSSRNFSDWKSMISHWKKHRDEFPKSATDPDLTITEYVVAARNFADHPEDRKNLGKYVSNAGSTSYCDFDTGEVVITDKNGVIRTYMNVYFTMNGKAEGYDIQVAFERMNSGAKPPQQQ